MVNKRSIGKKSEINMPKPQDEARSEISSTDYRSSVRSILEAEINAILVGEIKSASLEIIEEYRRAIKELVVQHKRALADELAEQKNSIRANKESVRQIINKINLT